MKDTSIKNALTGKNRKKSYSSKLKHPKWQRKRLEVMQRDDFKCQLCKDEETTLNVHHLKYSNGEPWEIENKNLITLCQDCHMMVEDLNNFIHFDSIDNIDVVKYKVIELPRIYFLVRNKSTVYMLTYSMNPIFLKDSLCLPDTFIFKTEEFHAKALSYHDNNLDF